MICERLSRTSDPVSESSTVSIWDLSNLHHIRDLTVLHDIGGCRLAIAPNGRTIASAACHTGIAVYDLDGERKWDLEKDQVQRLEFWDNDRLGIAYGDFSYEIRHADTGQLVASPPVYEVFFSPSRTTFLASDQLNEVLRIVQSDGITHRELLPMIGYAATVAYHSDEDVAFVSEHEGPLRCIDLTTSAIRWERPFRGKNRAWMMFLDGRLIGLAFNPNTGRGEIEVYDPKSGAVNGKIGPKERLKFELALPYSGRRVFSDGRVYDMNPTQCSLHARISANRTSGYDVKVF